MSCWMVEGDGATATVSFGNPPHHVLDHAGVGELESILSDLDRDGYRVVILTGADPSRFIAHADLRDIIAMSARHPTSGDPGSWPRMLRLLERSSFVTIAAISGAAWGGGLEIALTCGLRVLSETASLRFPEALIGILPAVAAHRLLASVPEHVALELLLLAEAFSAQDALRLGLVNVVVPDDEVLVRARAMATRIASLPLATAGAVRELVTASRGDEKALRVRQQELFERLVTLPATAASLAAAQAHYDAGGNTSDVFEQGLRGMR